MIVINAKTRHVKYHTTVLEEGHLWHHSFLVLNIRNWLQNYPFIECTWRKVRITLPFVTMFLDIHNKVELHHPLTGKKNSFLIKIDLSCFTRNMSTKLAAKTVHWLTEQLDHFASKDGKHRQ